MGSARSKLHGRLFGFLVAACLLASTLLAQPAIKFERLSVDQGLSQSSGRVILQDRRGFMWFGTEDGLNQYDGVDFTVYRHNPSDSTSISGNTVHALCEDGDGVIWVSTSGGLDRLQVEEAIFRRYPLGSFLGENDMVRTIYLDRTGTLWLGTNHGLLRFDRDTESFSLFRIDSLDSGANRIQVIYEDSENTLWIGAAGQGIFTFDRRSQRFQALDLDPKFQANFISAILEDQRARLWFAAFPAGLLRYERERQKIELFENEPNNPNSLSQNAVTSLAQDAHGNLWVGTESRGLNLFTYADESFTRYQQDVLDEASLSSNVVASLEVDDARTLWVGTAGGGINKYDPYNQRFHHIRNTLKHPRALKAQMLWSVFEDSEGLLWIGTQNGGLSRYDRSRDTFLRVDESFSLETSANIYAIAEDGAGVLWIGTSGAGLGRMNRRTLSFEFYRAESENPQALASNWIRSLYLDRSGTFWIGTNSGLHSLATSATEVSFRRYLEKLDDKSRPGANSILCLAGDRSGNLWLGTGRGAVRFDPERESYTHFGYTPGDSTSLSHDHVMTICEDASGTIWLGTAFGLNRYDPATESFTSYTTRDGLPNDVIYAILADDRGYIWLSSNRGLSKFDPDSETCKNFGLDDGLQSLEFNSSVAFKSRTGQMYFGGVNGLTWFHPDSVRDNPFVPPVVITACKTFERPVAFDRTEPIELSYRDDFITFEFAVLGYTNPQKNQHAYKLEGFNSDWIDCGAQRYATFTNLEPGEYVFRVKGSNNDGVWNEVGATVSLVITPPFWQTWWFRLLAAATALAGMALLVVHLNRKEKRKSELNKRISELKLRALRAQMNPHFVFNTINFIQYFISNNEQKAAYRYLSKFSKLMRRMLDNADQSTLTVADELESLRLYLELESMRFEGKFEYKVSVDPAIDIHNTEIPTMLIQPIVENAIHHGLRLKRSRGALRIDLQAQNGAIVCTVEDNGIGIEKSRELRARQPDQHRPIGMSVTRERLETLNALRQNGPGVEIADLSKQNGQGTRIRIVIPMED